MTMTDGRRYPDYQAWFYWLVFALGIGSFATNLFIPHVGEEGAYTLSSLEMWYRGEWILPTIHGVLYGRPPLLNWLIIPLANQLGWEHMLVASRLIAAGSTVGMALLLWYLIKKVTENGEFAAFSTVTFLSGDILVKRGWLAYADPLFSLFVFASVTWLLLAVQAKRRSLLGVALVALSCAFLTKTINAYVFYASAAAVLLVRSENGRFLLQPSSVVMHLIALGFPFFWYVHVSGGVHGPGMVQEILEKLEGNGFWPYVGHLLFYPLKTLAYFSPLSLLAIYFLARKKTDFSVLPSGELTTLLWILGLGFLPYWLAPVGSARYVMPLYPLFALMFAWIIWSAGRKAVRLAVNLMMGLIVLRYAWGIWGLPYFETHYRGGDYAAVAQKIMQRTGGYPLYTEDFSATGLSVSAEIDIRRLPDPPLATPPMGWENGFVISYEPDGQLGEVVEQFEFAQNSMYLLCRGAACAGGG